MRRLTGHIFWVLAVGFFGGLYASMASDFVISNARLEVEEVKSDVTGDKLLGLIGEDSQSVVEPPKVEALSAAPVLAMAGPVVFRVESEAASEAASSEGGQGVGQPSGGAVLVSTQAASLGSGREGILGLQEAFPDWQDGLRPRFIRFGEVW